jgi:SAM-dependent methyltransferase
MRELHSDFFKNKDLLEIGCGGSSKLDEMFCQTYKTRYVGIDPVSLPLIKAKLLPSKKLQIFLTFILTRLGWMRWSKWRRHILDSFPTRKLRGMLFDTIYANNSIEHWNEDLVDFEESIQAYKKDIIECNLLLKPGGILIVNCPIHVHGNVLFITGKVEAIEECFGDEWSSIVLEYWREQHDDLMPYCPEKRREFFQNKYGINLTNIWTINIIATK